MLKIKLVSSLGKNPPKILSGFPWCYRDEVSSHIKSVHPGLPVCLITDKEDFVAYGIGNSQSEISFRAWSFDERETDFFSQKFLIRKLSYLWRKKVSLGFSKTFRVCYSEGDGISGLIFDRYLSFDQRKQVFVFQISSAAFDFLIPNWGDFVKNFINELKQMNMLVPEFENTSIIIRRSERFKDVENMKHLPSLEVVQGNEKELFCFSVAYHFYPYKESNTINLMTNFIEGQKTGLFLDQSYNIGIVAELLASIFRFKNQIRILDLFCYRGAWSTCLSSVMKNKGFSVDVTLIDQSQNALDQAVHNIAPYADHINVLTGDVFNILDNHSHFSYSYDIIISDPPAFAKNKKNLSQALKGYEILNRKAIRYLNVNQGVLVACSCTSFVSEEMLKNSLRKAFYDQKILTAIELARGRQSLDHTVIAQFPEGFYLKMLVYTIETQLNGFKK